MNARIFNLRKLALANDPNELHIMAFIDEWIQIRGRPLPTEWQNILEKIQNSQPLKVVQTPTSTTIEKVFLSKK